MKKIISVFKGTCGPEARKCT